ncbi:MAG: hypothetical protein NVS9B10_22540 [Nevskia sp.]
MSAPDPAFVERISAGFARLIPHAQALGIEILGIEGVQVLARMPVQPAFLGDVERGIVHTGIVTSLIDSICGLAVFVRIGQRDTIATLDLRVDYLQPSRLGAALHCRAECYRLTDQIAFARATVWQQDEAAPVATSLSTFMRGNHTRGTIG